VLQLGSFIFFGSAYLLQERISTLVAAQRPRMVILDFSAVTGIDSSAGSAFVKIRELLHSQGIRHSVVGLSAPVRRIMEEAGSVDRRMPRHASLDEALEDGENLVLATLGLKPSQHRPLLDWFTDALCSADHARDLIDVLEPVQHADERYLCRQGDPTDTLLFVESGRVSVVIERPGCAAIRHRVFGANTVMGEIGFFLNAPRTASLRIDDHAVVWALRRASYQRLVEKRPELAAAVLTYTLRVQSERLAFATRQIAALHRWASRPSTSWSRRRAVTPPARWRTGRGRNPFRP
jgi:SulP family sulfate permease